MRLLDIDANLVKPGYTPLIITIVLAVALVLLFLSMQRQFRRINVPDDQDASDQEPAGPPVGPQG